MESITEHKSRLIIKLPFYFKNIQSKIWNIFLSSCSLILLYCLIPQNPAIHSSSSILASAKKGQQWRWRIFHYPLIFLIFKSNTDIPPKLKRCSQKLECLFVSLYKIFSSLSFSQLASFLQAEINASRETNNSSPHTFLVTCSMH